ncbi:MAG TPA: hypothetical protein VGV15_09390, partial [Terriglobales bacterium]|nr:hypothetical protein [Terriglobales bacterium]
LTGEILSAKNETHPIGPGGYQEPVSRYPHTGVRVQQQQAGMERVHIHWLGYAAVVGESNAGTISIRNSLGR